jgi:hypothetical protein
VVIVQQAVGVRGRVAALIGLLASSAGGLVGCNDCDRQGCDALQKRAPRGGTAVAGVVAAASDVVADGCEECPLGDERVELWKMLAPVASEAEAVAIVQGRAADYRFAASKAYSQSLASGGDYLLCARPNCVGIVVPDGVTVTVNIKGRDGSTGFFVAAEGTSGELHEQYGFEVGY